MEAKRHGGIHRLTAREVMAADDGDHFDGGQLLLRVRSASAVWVFRYTAPTGKRREMGLGACPRNDPKAAGASLAAARKSAAAARGMLEEFPPRDPLAERDRMKQEAAAAAEAKRTARVAERETLARVARRYHAQAIEPSKSRKFSMFWIGALERHVPASLWHSPIADVDTTALHSFLLDIHQRMADTALRVKRNLAEVYDFAMSEKLVSANPVQSLPLTVQRRIRESRPKSENHASLPYPAVPAFVADLRSRSSIVARCAEFTILTAARTGETIGARWTEIDPIARTWTVPASRMKRKDDVAHVVHLSERALAILEEMRELGSEWVFPSVRDLSRPMSNMAMLMLVQTRMGRRDVTLHGFRASFSTWANETGAARPDVIEAALAHKEGDRIRAAYNRATFAQARRALLEAWAAYIDEREAVGTVVALRTAA
ncbi:MAG: tyrosine-type recombinase/integrase [Rhodocyclaceae bacterium]|nr:tyrosine-type recombinase/integrase [Rhodocyclaceae bacterium]